jgi:hypothetical protein
MRLLQLIQADVATGQTLSLNGVGGSAEVKPSSD